MKITRLEIESFMGVKAIGVDIAPDGSMVVVGGHNAQGKSSLLRAIDEKNEAAGNAKEQRTKILDIIKEMGVKPDSDGSIHFRLGDVVIEVKQAEAKLHIKEKEPESDPEPDEAEQVEGTEQVSRRRRASNA